MTKEFRVSGMNCTGCEILVTEALEEIDGVDAVRASHAEGLVAVEYDPEKIDASAIATVIGAQGFNVVS